MNLALYIFLTFLVFYFCFYATNGEKESCEDIDGKEVEHGLLYVPGPNVCTQCVCHRSEPKWCQTMFCNGPPYMCKSYKVGKTCCQFECLDPPTEKTFLKELSRSHGSGHMSSSVFLFLLSAGLPWLLT